VDLKGSGRGINRRTQEDKPRKISVRIARVQVAGSTPDEVTAFSNRPKPSSRTLALGSTQPLAERSNRNLPGGRGRPEHRADLTASCEPIV
jgi:hypothetical protein